MIDPRHIGRTYPPTEPYEISRVKIREFAEAVGDPNPIYRDVAAARLAGHADVVAPPTFAIVISQPATRQASLDPELGIDYTRVVHGEQRFTHLRPLHAGDVVRTHLVIEAIRQSGQNWFLTLRTDVVAVDDDFPACTAYSTLVVRGSAA